MQSILKGKTSPERNFPQSMGHLRKWEAREVCFESSSVDKVDKILLRLLLSVSMNTLEFAPDLQAWAFLFLFF